MIEAERTVVIDVGIDAVWLSPITCSPNKDWGYDVSDYRDIDPSFGTLADLDRLVAEDAPAEGVRVVYVSPLKALAYDIRPEHQSAIRDLRAEAERNLASFDFVGVVEHFDHSMFALSDAVCTELAIRKVNVTAARALAPAAAPDEVELIRRLNPIDLALHAKAKARFEQTVLGATKGARQALIANRGG